METLHNLMIVMTAIAFDDKRDVDRSGCAVLNGLCRIPEVAADKTGHGLKATRILCLFFDNLVDSISSYIAIIAHRRACQQILTIL